MAARKPNPATNGLGSDGVDGLQRWATCRKKKLTTLCFEVSSCLKIAPDLLDANAITSRLLRLSC
jgi:hypothetical protein